MRVKVCGVTSEKDLAGAIKAGADALGFVVGFESSPRNISLRRAHGLISLVPPFVQSVLVTNRDFLSGRRVEVEAIDPDAIQLYGTEVVDGDSELPRATLIRPYFVGGDVDPRREAGRFDALLTTSHDVGTPGGSGKAPDLRACTELRKAISPKPLILSGGLTPETVGNAVQAVRPYAVDVSSGVESVPGSKDSEKMARFVKNAKEADDNA